MTDKSRGFGFVTFETLEAAEKALSSKNEILGKWVDVKHAERKDTRLVQVFHTTDASITNKR